MNTRLQRFLELEQLSPARLADILNIQRSGISHILSGRNKPGYDFLYKMNKKFPTLNIEWLISGTGKIYKDTSSLYKDSPKDDFPEPDLFNSNLYNSSIPTQPEQPSVNEEYLHQNEPSEVAENCVSGQKMGNPSVKRSLIKMILVYSDNTFKELDPIN